MFRPNGGVGQGWWATTVCNGEMPECLVFSTRHSTLSQKGWCPLLLCGMPRRHSLLTQTLWFLVLDCFLVCLFHSLVRVWGEKKYSRSEWYWVVMGARWTLHSALLNQNRQDVPFFLWTSKKKKQKNDCIAFSTLFAAVRYEGVNIHTLPATEEIHWNQHLPLEVCLSWRRKRQEIIISSSRKYTSIYKHSFLSVFGSDDNSKMQQLPTSFASLRLSLPSSIHPSYR